MKSRVKGVGLRVGVLAVGVLGVLVVSVVVGSLGQLLVSMELTALHTRVVEVVVILLPLVMQATAAQVSSSSAT